MPRPNNLLKGQANLEKRQLVYEPVKPRVNVMEIFSSALADVEIARDKVRALVNSDNRHGDLQIALMAARRFAASLEALIAAGEVS